MNEYVHSAALALISIIGLFATYRAICHKNRFSMASLKRCERKRAKQRAAIERFLQKARDNFAFVQRLNTGRVTLLPDDTEGRIIRLISDAEISFNRDDFDLALKLSKQAAHASDLTKVFCLEQSHGLWTP